VDLSRATTARSLEVIAVVRLRIVATVVTLALLALLIVVTRLLRRASAQRAAALASLRQREEQLRDSEERLSLAIAAAGIGIWDYNVETGEWYFSPRLSEILGVPLDETDARWREVVHAGDVAKVESAFSVGASDTQEKNFRFRVVRPGGEERSVVALAHVHRDQNGLALRVVGTVTDLTDQHQAELARRDSQLFLDSIIQELPNMVFVKDAEELRFVRVNRAGEELLGYSNDDLVGKNDFDFFPLEQAEYFTAKDREVLDSGKLVDIESELISTRTMGDRILHTRKIPIHDAQGRPKYLLGISEDVTEREEARGQLHQARIAAEEANQAKNEFLSRMSHELRTPLNAILGFSQLIELETTSDAQRESSLQIQRAGHHLLDLINEVLDIVHIESGRLTVSLEAISIADICHEALNLIAPIASSRYIEVATNVPKLDADHVHADRQRLMQVLLNLLSNAVKYNRHGGAVRLTRERRPNRRLRISICDEGGGMTREQLGRLFTPFERLDAAVSGVEGTGLGLALSSRLVQAMGGTIGVDSTPGTGSTFWFELPLAEAPTDRAARSEMLRAAPKLGSTRTVLYVEDNPSIVRLVERILLHRPRVRLLKATTGWRGIELARRQRPDVILIDLHLPDMTGEALLRHLQAEPSIRDLPVVVVSADATPRQISRLRDAGAVGYLTKPFDIARFLDVIDGHFEEAEADKAGDHAPL
jgi:PAS domain S-box-containing protein